MTTFPGSPRLIKGAIVGLDPMNPAARVVIAFQYNPDTMTRRLEPRSSGGGEGSRSEPFRVTSAPKETITLNIEIDAIDQLEQANSLAVTKGIYPTLSALEILLYPKSADVKANASFAQAGNIEIIPQVAPLTLFVWGPQRVLPVRLTGVSITEQAFDTRLNPISAKVDLTLLVLSYYDLKSTDPGYSLFLAHQIDKETLAASNATNNQDIGVSLDTLPR